MGSAQGVEGRGSVRPFLDVACGEPTCRAFAVVRRVHLRQAALGVVEMPHLLLCAVCGMAMPALASWCGPVRDLEEGELSELSELRNRWAEQHAGVTHRIEVLEENMPKVTRLGGPSNKADIQPPETETVIAEHGPEEIRPYRAGKRSGEPSEQANAMVNDSGDLFFPDNDEDARSFREGHGARPVNPDRFAELFPGLDIEGGEQPSAGSSSETSQSKPPPSEMPNEAAHQKPAPTTGSRSKRGRTGSSTARSTGGSGSETATPSDA